MSEEDEERIYHIVCDIARTSKKYFYDRKYVPTCVWSVDNYIKKILISADKLKKEYDLINQKRG